MKNIFHIYVYCFLLVCFNVAICQDLYLFGGDKNEVKLGCITCNKYDSESIWNKYGTYGSKYNVNSIWNKYGTYGSKYNTFCPWNKYSNNAPAIVDKSGNFYGYFSTNTYISKRTQNEWLLYILENYEWIMENFDEYIDKLKLN